MKQSTGNKNRLLGNIFLIILIIYPMRHINWGLDWWDTGYNYANFQYMGLEHMDSMWLFSTYLANAAGHLLTKLPFAGSLMGMNFYTGIFVSVLAAAGYLFCTKKLGIPSWITFVGEMAAVSLCWCPTALLYNYLTYVLFLGCVILIYEGLTKEKSWCLFGAGLCLGTNVLVRFSNLPEAALILAVWAYGVLEAMEARKMKGAEEPEHSKKSGKSYIITVRRTLWCMGGWFTALAVLFGYIHVRYGIDSYIAGIQRLFAMTDNAVDYKPASMIIDLIYTYRENLYWVIRILIIVAGGMVLFGMLEYMIRPGSHRTVSVLRRILKILWCAVAAAMLGWLYYRGFCSLEFYTYGSILRPGILFLMLTMGIALIRIFHKSCSREEKLISGMLILVVLLTSIGSNNNVYPSLNNLFLAAPYTLWQSYCFIRKAGDRKWHGVTLCSFPAKGILTAFLGMVLVQSFLFGACFVFAEATGVREVTARVENNEVLRGIRMNPQRAEWMTQISAHIEERGLKGKDVVLYGKIPALSYYLQMPPAFNSWSELESYSLAAMEKDMDRMREKMQADDSFRPVIILEDTYIIYLEGGKEALEEKGIPQKDIEKMEQDGKWKLLVDFIDTNNYENTFRNAKFGVWE